MGFPHRNSLTPMVLACALILGGCAATKPSRFYLLTPLPQSGKGILTATAAQGLAIGIGPIELPSYLNRPQIVTRASQNELQLAEFNHWAEPLEETVTRVLAENLSVLLSTDDVAVFPWKQAIKVDYQATVEVMEFDIKSNGESSLVTRWRIFTDNGRTVLMTKRSSFSQNSTNQDFREMASAMSRNLADLSEEIAQAIKARIPKKPDR